MEFGAVPGNYDHIIVNNDLDKAYAELKQILDKDIVDMMKNKKAC